MDNSARSSFIFYRSFSEAICELDDPAIRLQLFEAICKFGLYGKEPDNLSGIAKALWLSFRPLLEANRQKWLNGMKGGCPTGTKKPSMVGNSNATKPKQNQNKTETIPNINVNVNNNIKKKENIKKEINAPISEEESKFNAWLDTNYKALTKLQQPLTYEQYQVLCGKYGIDLVTTKMASFCNTIYKNKNYVSAYLTLNLWCKKQF